ncbi:hypothetical protein HYH03_003595 [Edaphochlamys debaryana]|uniref:Protein kinase domain-containing protein n=1 Tax=Edaphochlamys debaryana TaxID=47281 RepID=A0A835YGM7_9CHLO|nr:hypothetical protein HYH03_003595 [Edaphochlamys debaryana]|eukprot:KAG2498335.1 hypothetical protein HYH03_003595 [Edaphochlamys debaryana]
MLDIFRPSALGMTQSAAVDPGLETAPSTPGDPSLLRSKSSVKSRRASVIDFFRSSNTGFRNSATGMTGEPSEGGQSFGRGSRRFEASASRNGSQRRRSVIDILGHSSKRFVAKLMNQNFEDEPEDEPEPEGPLWFTSLADFKPLTFKYLTGRFTHAYFACSVKTGEHYILKQFEKAKMSSNDERGVRRALAFAQMLEHEHLTRCCGTWEDEEAIYIVEEYATKGDLLQDSMSHPEKYTEAFMATKVVKPLLEVLSYLHNINVVHRAIFPEYVMFGREDKLKLGHFTSAIDQRLDPPNERIQFLDYMPPEMLAVREMETALAKPSAPHQTKVVRMAGFSDDGRTGPSATPGPGGAQAQGPGSPLLHRDSGALSGRPAGGDAPWLTGAGVASPVMAVERSPVSRSSLRSPLRLFQSLRSKSQNLSEEGSRPSVRGRDPDGSVHGSRGQVVVPLAAGSSRRALASGSGDAPWLLAPDEAASPSRALSMRSRSAVRRKSALEDMQAPWLRPLDQSGDVAAPAGADTEGERDGGKGTGMGVAEGGSGSGGAEVPGSVSGQDANGGRAPSRTGSHNSGSGDGSREDPRTPSRLPGSPGFNSGGESSSSPAPAPVPTSTAQPGSRPTSARPGSARPGRPSPLTAPPAAAATGCGSSSRPTSAVPRNGTHVAAAGGPGPVAEALYDHGDDRRATRASADGDGSPIKRGRTGVSFTTAESRDTMIEDDDDASLPAIRSGATTARSGGATARSGGATARSRPTTANANARSRPTTANTRSRPATANMWSRATSRVGSRENSMTAGGGQMMTGLRAMMRNVTLRIGQVLTRTGDAPAEDGPPEGAAAMPEPSPRQSMAGGPDATSIIVPANPWEWQEHYNEKVDLWQVGCLCHEILCASLPFEAEDKLLAAALILWADIVSFPDHLSPECHSFMRACLTKNPAERPSAAELLQHPWVVRHAAGETLKSVRQQREDEGLVEGPDGQQLTAFQRFARNWGFGWAVGAPRAPSSSAAAGGGWWKRLTAKVKPEESGGSKEFDRAMAMVQEQHQHETEAVLGHGAETARPKSSDVEAGAASGGGGAARRHSLEHNGPGGHTQGWQTVL